MSTAPSQLLQRAQAPNLDLSEWPLVIFHAPASMTNEEMQTVMDAVHEIYQHGESFGFLLDLRKYTKADPEQRKIMTDSLARNEEFGKKYCVGAAMIFSSPVVRGILTALHWVRPPVYPQKVFKEEPDARAWVTAKLRERLGPSAA